ncbi:uncharacterized protein BO80DRAFT_191955 [Aspergillus ibericus CBS 121593]|uniref:Uncharacterized protein n=1 Tax=Aspergillus ibericus CBS 121593 TaxID=1448316 RepID=A0A395GPF2_9EURO|nr:hypothetical protein BO80DRAFT_191955 [Aspergillus ibericus CBS 121593]RAK97390.1 hypothetical protein BO80DRAFT_191955 [Aspergillus ibericus CBS 121593]
MKTTKPKKTTLTPECRRPFRRILNLDQNNRNLKIAPYAILYSPFRIAHGRVACRSVYKSTHPDVEKRNSHGQVEKHQKMGEKVVEVVVIEEEEDEEEEEEEEEA